MMLAIEAICLVDAGREEDARAALKQAREILEPVFPTDGTRIAPPLEEGSLFQHAHAQILYREAEGRLQGAGFPADRFVPVAR